MNHRPQTAALLFPLLLRPALGLPYLPRRPYSRDAQLHGLIRLSSLSRVTVAIVAPYGVPHWRGHSIPPKGSFHQPLRPQCGHGPRTNLRHSVVVRASIRLPQCRHVPKYFGWLICRLVISLHPNRPFLRWYVCDPRLWLLLARVTPIHVLQIGGRLSSLRRGLRYGAVGVNASFS